MSVIVGCPLNGILLYIILILTFIHILHNGLLKPTNATISVIVCSLTDNTGDGICVLWDENEN